MASGSRVARRLLLPRISSSCDVKESESETARPAALQRMVFAGRKNECRMNKCDRGPQ